MKFEAVANISKYSTIFKTFRKFVQLGQQRINAVQCKKRKKTLGGQEAANSGEFL